MTTVKLAFQEIDRFRHLLACLTWRDLKVRYAQSYLGVLWAVAVPFSMMLVFTFVFTQAVDTSVALETPMPYALYAYAGLVPWTFLSQGLNNSLNSLTAHRNLVSKVYFPREALPLSCVAAAAIDFLVALSVLGGLMVYFQWTGAFDMRLGLPMLLLPVLTAVEAILISGVGMLLAAAHLFYRDVRPIFGVLIPLGMFLSGVVVPLPDADSAMGRVLRWNPVVPLIEAYRDCILNGRWPDGSSLLYAGFAGVIALLGGWLVFRRVSCRFAERI
jgi:ABC-type polysaccharide/polyol phosphate export permease